ncbi:hypothetical protein IC582_010425 [Cucumis melo]
MIVFVVVLYGSVERIWKCEKVCWYFRSWILIVGVYYWFAMEGSMRFLIYVIIYIYIYIYRWIY